MGRRRAAARLPGGARRDGAPARPRRALRGARAAAGCPPRTVALIRGGGSRERPRGGPAPPAPPTRRAELDGAVSPSASPPRRRSVIAAGSRPDRATHVRLAECEGPLGLLLALIEARQLDVLTVPLGALADAYLDALAGLDGDRMGNVSAFVAVASQLILIKSRALLPRPPDVAAVPLDDEPGPGGGAARPPSCTGPSATPGPRLAAPGGRRGCGSSAASRPSPLAAARAGVGAAGLPRLDPALLVAALERLVAVVPPPPVAARGDPAHRSPSTSGRDLIRAALAGAGPVVLQELLRGVRDRVVVAVTFLAMLELVKRREVVVEQDEPWGPIIVRAMPRAAGRAAGGGRVSDVGERTTGEGRESVDRRATGRDEPAPPRQPGPRRRTPARAEAGLPGRRADRGAARGAPVRRRAAARPARARAP